MLLTKPVDGGKRPSNLRLLVSTRRRVHAPTYAISDRVNRIGQKRDVQVYQMITDDTVESKVLEIQARKKAMIDQVSAMTTYTIETNLI